MRQSGFSLPVSIFPGRIGRALFIAPWGVEGEGIEEADDILVAAGAYGREGRNQHVEAGAGVDEARIHDAAAGVAGFEGAVGKSLDVAWGLADQRGLGAGYGSVAGGFEGLVRGLLGGAGDGRIVLPGHGKGGFGVRVGEDHLHLLSASGFSVGGNLDLLDVGGHFDFETVMGAVDFLPVDGSGVDVGIARRIVTPGRGGMGAGESEGLLMEDDVDDGRADKCAPGKDLPRFHTLKTANSVGPMQGDSARSGEAGPIAVIEAGFEVCGI
jgi:hypothetical protein